MDNVSMIGIDISKSSFQVHGATASGQPVLRKKLSRGKVLEFLASQPACLVMLKTCGGAYHSRRDIQPLGHEVRLIVPIAHEVVRLPLPVRIVPSCHPHRCEARYLRLPKRPGQHGTPMTAANTPQSDHYPAFPGSTLEPVDQSERVPRMTDRV